MFKITNYEVEECIGKALDPVEAYKVSTKASKNYGFDSNPKAIHAVTKLLTLNLELETRELIEKELIKCANWIDHDRAKTQIKFIRSCMMDINSEAVEMISQSEEYFNLWNILDSKCSRDGTLFLQFVYENNDKAEVCEKFMNEFIKKVFC